MWILQNNVGFPGFWNPIGKYFLWPEAPPTIGLYTTYLYCKKKTKKKNLYGDTWPGAGRHVWPVQQLWTLVYSPMVEVRSHSSLRKSITFGDGRGRQCVGRCSESPKQSQNRVHTRWWGHIADDWEGAVIWSVSESRSSNQWATALDLKSGPFWKTAAKMHFNVVTRLENIQSCFLLFSTACSGSGGISYDLNNNKPWFAFLTRNQIFDGINRR